MACMANCYEKYPSDLKNYFPTMNQQDIENSVKKTIQFMQNLSKMVIETSIDERDIEFSKDEWKSGDDDNSRGSESDRYLKLREDIPS